MRKGLILPAGEYYIGDPCYLFGKSWDDILEVTNVFENDVDEYKNHKFFVGNTAYGDGEYYDRNGHPYPVDSGLIGVFPIKVIEIDNHIKLEEILEYGNLVTFKEDFQCIVDDGYFDIGNIEIETNSSWDEEEDDFFEDEDDWDEDDDEYDTNELDEHDKDYANFEHNKED